MKKVKLCINPMFLCAPPQEPINEKECKVCKRFGEVGNPVLYEGSFDSKYVFVGREPGEVECEKGKPFHPEAPGGGLLVEYLETLGLTRKQIFITNVCYCRGQGNRPPTAEEVYNCMKHHAYEANNLKNVKYIFPLGTTAFQLVTGIVSSVTPFVGSMFRGKFGDRVVYIFPLHHPGYLLRRPSERKVTFETMREIGQMLRKKERDILCGVI